MANIAIIPLLKALGHEKRLQMIELLLARKLCVRALAQETEITEAAASQHLKILREAGLVKGEKIGYWTHYVVQAQELQRLGQQLMDISANAPKLRDLNLILCGKNKEDNRPKGGE